MSLWIKISKNILIRDLSDDDINWLDCNRSPGVTQNDFLKSLVSEARLSFFSSNKTECPSLVKISAVVMPDIPPPMTIQSYDIFI